jgi:SET domain-containing protein
LPEVGLSAYSHGVSKPKSKPRSPQGPAYRLRNSSVHGTGMFATRTIRKGACLIEYEGERISHEEADRRHAAKVFGDNHTFLFTIDENIVVDGNVGGNASRFINHSCDPNCEVIIEDGRLLIETIRTIRRGEEIGYRYLISRADDDPPEVDQIFACRCGAKTCEGTMLEPRKTKRKTKTTAAKQKTKPTDTKKTAAKRKPKRAA